MIQTQEFDCAEVAARLSRIETVLEAQCRDIADMRDAVVRLVRIEEQQTAMRDAVTQTHERLDGLDERCDDFDVRITDLERVRAVAGWVAGIAASVIAAAVSIVMGRLL